MKKIILTAGMMSSICSVHAASQKGFDIEMYGFLKASAMYSSQALSSYNNINMSAPTNVAPAGAEGTTNAPASLNDTSRMSFQTQQTRIGFNLKKDEHLSAKFEFDFIDFNKSSPTTQMNPRVRIAAVTYAWDNHKVIIGQDWDLFSPVTTYTFDYVGLYFLAGNTGFMRQQAQYLNTQGKWEFGAAIGMAGNNPGVSDNDLETGKAPTYAGRISYALENGRVGISAIYASLKYSANNTKHDSYAYNAFFEKSFGALALKSEAYYGQNLANLGSLSIGKGTSTSDVKEYGGNVTMSYKLSDKHSPFGGIGLAKVDNQQEVTPVAFSTTGALTSPGIASNALIRLGWEYRVTEDFSWITEVSRYETKNKISANKYGNDIAESVESGVQLRF